MTPNDRDAVLSRPICFDATGTLFEARRPVGETYRGVALDFGVDLPAWRLDDAFRRVLSRAPIRGTEGATPEARRAAELDWWRERIRQTFQATDSTVRFADFAAFAEALINVYRSAEAWTLRPETLSTLQGLTAAGTPLAVVSNFDHRLQNILQALEIRSYFEVIAIPSTSGSAKPDLSAFEPVWRHFGCGPDQLVYVGDDSPETLAALAPGLHAVVDVRAANHGPPGPGDPKTKASPSTDPPLIERIRAAARNAPAATL